MTAAHFTRAEIEVAHKGGMARDRVVSKTTQQLTTKDCFRARNWQDLLSRAVCLVVPEYIFIFAHTLQLVRIQPFDAFQLLHLEVNWPMQLFKVGIGTFQLSMLTAY